MKTSSVKVVKTVEFELQYLKKLKHASLQALETCY